MDLNTLIEAALFSPESLRSPSAWTGHLPLAAWVIREVAPGIFVELGTHTGNSYFSFCQSVVEAGLATKCYAVDTWHGDEHAGQYNEEVFAEVNAHNENRYAGFSRLLRMTFDDALGCFSDASIDLLHIDGLHTYEAVRHDFETWRPKLAPGAIVMFHDTGVRELNFGVWKLWEELRAEYPNNIEFSHSHGLGILQLNNAPDVRRQKWLQLDVSEKDRLTTYFAALGSRQLERFELNSKLSTSMQEVSARDAQIADLGRGAAERDVLIADLRHHASNLEQEVSALDAQIAALGRAAAERDVLIADLRQHASNLGQKVSARDAAIASLGQTVAARDDLISGLNRDVHALRHSTSWRITKPLRLVSRFLRTSGKRLSFSWTPRTVEVYTDGLPGDFDRHGRLKGRAYSYEPETPGTIAEPAEQVAQYITNRLEPDPDELPDGFNRDVYLTLNPDLAASGVDPTSHYLRHGRLEGRAYSYPGIDLTGTHHFRAGLDSILVVSHEASRTGAPIVSLNLVSNLVGRYNVVVLLLGDGPLVHSFERTGAVTLVSHLRRYPMQTESVVGRLHDQFRFKFAFVNSIESRVVLKSLATRFIPVVSLVHEFAAYTRPRNAFAEAILWSSEVVFSANVTRQSVLQQPACADIQSVHTLPQGRCLVPAAQVTDEELERETERLSRWMRPEGTGDGLVIVLGAGTVQLRKGVDLFIEVAARVVSAPGGDNCRFVWLGNGYDPDGDVHYSAYLVDQIQRSGLEGHIFFPGETPAIEAAYQEADIFLMSSRLDPMPNVAVDALAHGKPVLCFDRASGIADFLNGSGLGDHCVARYLDTADMADKIRALANSKNLREEVGKRGREASVSYFNMKDYVTRLEALARKAVDRGKREEQDVELIVGSALFRLDFSVPPDLAPLSLDSAVRLHVRSWASGIGRRKPFPGFHPGVYLEEHGVAIESSDPTADYIRAGRPNGPWNSTVISESGGDARDLPENDSIALHLHVFYPDLLPDIMAHLSCNRCRPDLLVSVTSEEARDLVARHLESYEGKVAAIEVVPNRGRDIGPFLTQFGQRILSEYAYVGHIHTKKTEAVKDAALGKTWFEFLMANLLGGRPGAMADAILASMTADRSLGMVFPDDPNAQGWNANRGFAEALASKMGIEELPQHFNFPVGTMFWARTCALSPLLNLNLQWDDYPPEPLPYDGTLLHAIERLLPLTLGAGTLRAAVTNVTGQTR